MPQFARPATRKAATIQLSFARSWLWIPSSTAYFARNGGASAVAVAARSETIESVVRHRYGAVRRASVASRRRVLDHDQSSTSAPRSRIRWPPGCQTLIARPPRRWRIAVRIALRVHARASPPGWGPPPPATRNRRYPTTSYTSVPTSCRMRASRRRLQRFFPAASLDRVRELPLEETVLVDVAVHRTRPGQLLVGAARGDPAVVEHDDL